MVVILIIARQISMARTHDTETKSKPYQAHIHNFRNTIGILGHLLGSSKLYAWEV
jgi:hypothetical protein